MRPIVSGTGKGGARAPLRDDHHDTLAEAMLGELMESLGVDFVRVLAAPPGIAQPVGEVTIYDPLVPQPPETGGLLLGVGIDPESSEATELLRNAAAAGAAAVLLRVSSERPAELVEAAQEHGVGLVAVTRDVPWGQLHTLLRTAQATTGNVQESVRDPAPVGDLFTLANAVATMVGGPTVIEDRHARVLAYSSLDDPIDEYRRRTILGRQVPDEWLERFRRDGVLDRLWGSGEVVHIDYSHEDPDFRPRMALAVRAGEEILGVISVAEGQRPLGEEAEYALREAARTAGLHLLRHRSVENLERQRQGQRLRAFLEGRTPPEMARRDLGIDEETPVTMVAVELERRGPAEEISRVVRAIDAVALYYESYRRQALCGAIGSVIYALIPAEGTENRAGLIERTVDMTRHTADAVCVGVRAAIGSTLTGLKGAVDSKREADLVLRVLAEEGTSVAVAPIEEVRSRTLFLELIDLIGDDATFRAGQVAAIGEHDRRKGTEYLPTLKAHLDTFGNVSAAAETSHVHPNTFRYRLRRLTELFEVDLSDPIERLVLHLQLHLPRR